jgi:phosphoribosyl-dephospho-CoA transferase
MLSSLRIDMKRPLRRHDLAYLSEDAAICAAICPALPPLLHAWISDWIARGQPLVVARQHPLQDAAEPQIHLGAALPLRLGRAKVACSVALTSLVRTTPALSTEKVSNVLPGRDARALARLSEWAERFGIELGVYGSTAWECLSGAGYRRSDSDVDLICDVRRRGTLTPWLRAMDAAAREMDGHLDGEIRFPNGRAVAWRELACAGLANVEAHVLVKNLDSVNFVPVGALMESLA